MTQRAAATFQPDTPAARRSAGQAPPRSLRDRLRSSTHGLHARIEAIWSPGQGFASAQAYRRFLEVLLHAHRMVGLPAAKARLDAIEIAYETARIDALYQDLDRPAEPETVPPPMGFAEAWGAGYVLNGSALGASMMLKGGYLGSDWPSRYMALGGEYVRSGNLRRFFDALNTRPLDIASVERGAKAAFALFEIAPALAEPIPPEFCTATR